VSKGGNLMRTGMVIVRQERLGEGYRWLSFLKVGGDRVLLFLWSVTGRVSQTTLRGDIALGRNKPGGKRGGD